MLFPKIVNFLFGVLFLCGIVLSANGSVLGLGLGFLTESNKPYSVNGVTGPILKNTTEVTWTWRVSKSPSQRAPVGDPVKRGGRGGKVIQNKRRAKNDTPSSPSSSIVLWECSFGASSSGEKTRKK